MYTVTTELTKIMLAIWRCGDYVYDRAGDGEREVKLSSIVENQKVVFKQKHLGTPLMVQCLRTLPCHCRGHGTYPW